ncbi:Oidioi.mRNA.OKI2018_I69.XSR.g15745.t1.cds [Oikopleura dioica]|uniref:Oidioi.mRNA.OKI2018_I69.XSR.g15745.t1.cds n=1 Tax=Oikopleura dioica TaxID=34765 RepID=A0ABN7SN34_OIKDI|nr:Oidioi.mRNA.OKI2018_I69.XSR.g15745.t1.cds [Oikopleura dioica]
MNNYYDKIPEIYHFPILVILFGAFAILLSAIFMETPKSNPIDQEELPSFIASETSNNYVEDKCPNYSDLSICVPPPKYSEVV